MSRPLLLICNLAPGLTAVEAGVPVSACSRPQTVNMNRPLQDPPADNWAVADYKPARQQLRPDSKAHIFLFTRVGEATMDDIHPPTSWLLPSIDINITAHRLQQQLRELQCDIAELTLSTENAANRIAAVLKQLRSQDEPDSHKPDEAASHESEVSASIRNHPFASFFGHDSFQSAPSASFGDRNVHNTKPPPLPTVDAGKDTARQFLELASSPLSSTATVEAPCRSTYEQSRTFLAVTSSLKDDAIRTYQCEIVEKRITILTQQIKPATSADVCWLIARQIIAYLHFLNLAVEEALESRGLAQEVKDPIFDGIVALVFIHFGIFDVAAASTGSRRQLDESMISSPRRFSKLLKSERLSKLVPKRSQSDSMPVFPHRIKGKRPTRIAALSTEALVAVTELCLQSVLSSTVLSDILALFALGDVEDNFSVVDGDRNLLRAFLDEGLLPRSASISAKLGGFDPIRDVQGVLEAMNQLKESKKASTSPSGRRFRFNSFQSEDTEWIKLEIFPNFTGSRWSQQSQVESTTPSSFSSLTTRTRPTNMLDVHNNRTVA
ncbi:uncharacterized protein UTRI_01889 [Ustilago trichophora]|uniref:Uncharacterized protein n=1 Tax=Ustilago trichophora TaxID=86804 RepID=A0A5C3E124_9BASI|nr:uncharacterized protein UTRI_01889 [Ustilago trichophora]